MTTKAPINTRDYHRTLFAAHDAPRTVAEAISRSGLNFTVEKRPMFLQDGTLVTTHRAMTRTDSGKLLAVVGDKYEAAQQHAALAFVQPIVDAGEARIVAAGYLDDGAKVFIEAELVVARPAEVSKGDVVSTRIMFTNSHDGSSSATAWYSLLRLICLNGMTAAEQSRIYSASHRSGIHGKLDAARGEFAAHRQLAQGEVELFQHLATRRLSETNLRRYVRETLSEGAGNDETKVVRHVDRIIELNETAPGATPGSLYGGLNALTYWATHERGRSENARNSALIFGQGGALIRRAADVAKAYAPRLPGLLAA